MNFLKSSILKDLRRRFHDPWVLLMWLGIPLLVGSTVTAISGGVGGAPPTAQLLVADQDQSFISGLIVGAFGQGALADLVQVESVELEAGRKRIDGGDGSALLIVPQGFGNAVLKEEKTNLVLLTNPSQQILPNIIEESLSILVDGVFYLQRVFGEELQSAIGLFESTNDDPSGFSDADVAQLSVSFNQSVQRLTQSLFPPLIDIQTSVQDESSEAINFSLLFFPGILLMALLITTQGLSEDLWKERELGTLRRLANTPRSVTSLLLAKLVYGALIMASIALVLLMIGFVYHQLPLSKLPLALVWLVAAGIVFQLLFGLIGLYAPTRRAAALINSVLLFPLMMIGGSFFPFEAMPEWMVVIGQWSPNGLVLNQLKDYLLDRHQLDALLIGFGTLAATGTLLFLFSAFRNQTFARS